MEKAPVISQGTNRSSTYRSCVPLARSPVTYQVSMIFTSEGRMKHIANSGPYGPMRGTSPSTIGAGEPTRRGGFGQGRREQYICDAQGHDPAGRAVPARDCLDDSLMARLYATTRR